MHLSSAAFLALFPSRLFTRTIPVLSKAPLRAQSAMTASASQKKIATHDGTFHCDEVLACHLLRHHPQFSNATIIRTRDPAILKTADIVVDVGAVYDPALNQFDHHQRGFSSTFSDVGKRSHTKLSSAGLIYKHFGFEVVSKIAQTAKIELSDSDLNRVYLKVYDSFMEAVDAIDNGIHMYYSNQPPRYESSTDLSARVGKLNADWFEKNPDQDANFFKALALAGTEMDSHILHVIKSWLPARVIVTKALKARFDVSPSGAIVVMTEFAPWKDHIFSLEEEEKESGVNKEVKYILYKDMTGSSWRIQCVPIAKGSFQSRQPLPEPWRGLRDDTLDKETGISGCVFVHTSGFIGGNNNFEGVLAMAKKALESN